MEDKNRFSILLEHLLEVAEVKNYTLAKRLQYDVSYISKWVSGRMLPAKKTEKRVMEGISACVVDEATDDGRNLLLREYSVSIPSDLKAAIYDNLIAEYDYLQEELDSGEARIGPYTDFWAELNMLQYLTKMAHPVLRRVSQLDIVAVMDLMEMAREYRLKVANLQNGFSGVEHLVIPEEVDGDRSVILCNGSLMRHFTHLLAQIDHAGLVDDGEEQDKTGALLAHHAAEAEHDQTLILGDDADRGDQQKADGHQSNGANAEKESASCKQPIHNVLRER